MPYLQADTSVRPPFTATQISEAALRDEVDRIHASAVHETRVYYDRRTAVGAANAGSWVVRWLLWYMLMNGDEQAASDSFEAQLSAQPPRKSPETALRRSLHATNGVVMSNDKGRSNQWHGIDLSMGLTQLLLPPDNDRNEQARKQYWDPARPT